MKHALLRFLFTSMAVLFVAALLPGIKITNALALFVTVFFLGILNTLLRPIMILITLPMTIFTFGLFIFIINGLILYLTSMLVSGFEISSILVAIIASILISIFSALINWLARGQTA
jgi:putative membrane protein